VGEYFPAKTGEYPRLWHDSGNQGPITKIKQSQCSIAGPVFSKYRTGHCPEWSRTCVFAVFAFFSRVIYLLLTNLARDRTGRISALGPYCQDLGPIFSQYGPHAWLIRYIYCTVNSLSLSWFAENVRWIFEISVRDVITADYTIIMSRTLKVTGNHGMYNRGAWFLRVIMSSSRASCCIPSVKEQKHDFFPVQCIIKQLLDLVFVISRIIEVSVRVISLRLRLRLITLTSTSIILDITKPHPIIVYPFSRQMEAIVYIWGDIFGLIGKFFKISIFNWYFDRSKTRHDRAKLGLAGQHDRPTFKNYFEPWSCF